MKKKIFWKDNVEGEFRGGYYFRAFDLIKFMKLVEKEEIKQQESKILGQKLVKGTKNKEKEINVYNSSRS